MCLCVALCGLNGGARVDEEDAGHAEGGEGHHDRLGVSVEVKEGREDKE